MCGPDTIVVLSSSCDHAFDDEKFPMNDWEHVDDYNLEGNEKKFVNYMSQLPCIGKVFKGYMFDYLAFSYDMTVNFIEAHEQASKMIQGVIDNQEFVDVILKEAKQNIMAASKYVAVEIENIFPEIAKSIQHRRAEFYLLTHKAHYVHKMVNHGQIEDNDAKNLLSEIDKKIYNIKSEDIEIEIMDHKDRIAHLSDLAEVFSKEELE